MKILTVLLLSLLMLACTEAPRQERIGKVYIDQLLQREVPAENVRKPGNLDDVICVDENQYYRDGEGKLFLVYYPNDWETSQKEIVTFVHIGKCYMHDSKESPNEKA